MSNTGTHEASALVAPEKLTWKKSEFGGYSASRGDLMFWSRSKYGTAFAEHTTCRVGFKVSRKRHGKGWELRIWTHSLTSCFTAQFETMAQAKEAATLYAAALAWRYDGELPSDNWLVDGLLRDARGGIEIWVTYPEQRDEWMVKRLAENHVLVTI